MKENLNKRTTRLLFVAVAITVDVKREGVGFRNGNGIRKRRLEPRIKGVN